jgi:hypothetical protein
MNIEDDYAWPQVDAALERLRARHMAYDADVLVSLKDAHQLLTLCGGAVHEEGSDRRPFAGRPHGRLPRRRSTAVRRPTSSNPLFTM